MEGAFSRHLRMGQGLVKEGSRLVGPRSWRKAGTLSAEGHADQALVDMKTADQLLQLTTPFDK